MILGRCPGEQLGRFTPHRESRRRKRRHQETEAVGRAPHIRAFQRVDDDVGSFRLAQLVDQTFDLFLILGRRPGNHLVLLGTLRKTCIRKHTRQETHGKVDTSGIHAF